MGSHDWAVGVCAKPGDADAGAGRVDASLQQVLTLKLAGSLADKEIVSAELDIEAKFQAKVEAQLYLDGALVTTLQLDATKGPFSGGGDNLRWVIGRSDPNPSATDSVFYTGPVGLFDELRLRAVEGAFSLESGLDGTAAGEEGQWLNTKESLFQLTDSEGVLACGDVVTEAGSATSPSATFTRIDTNGADCNTLIPYSLTSAGGTLSRTMTLTKPTVTGAQFTIVIGWDPETAQYPLTRTTTIDYLNGNGRPADPVVRRYAVGPLAARRTGLVPHRPAGPAHRWRADQGDRDVLRRRRPGLLPAPLSGRQARQRPRPAGQPAVVTGRSTRTPRLSKSSAASRSSSKSGVRPIRRSSSVLVARSRAVS